MAHNLYHTCAFQLATGLCVDTDGVAPVGYDSIMRKFAAEFSKPEYSDRTVTIGEMAQWYLRHQLADLLSIAAKG